MSNSNLLGGATLCLFFVTKTFLVPVWIALSLLALSRVFVLVNYLSFLFQAPLWAYDLVETQVVQETVDQSERGKMAGVENTLTSGFSLLSYAVAIALVSPSNFVILGAMSALFCGFAGGCYSRFFSLNHRTYSIHYPAS